jgi:LacI family repressor for deo operon, udp, cdd, tsx, nupC, and nupG
MLKRTPSRASPIMPEPELSERNANIQEVAAAAGVSVATVSRTLQFPHQVADDTKERVHAAIDRLRYVPNAQARNLRRSRTGLVVALVPDIANPFFAGIIRGIEAVAKQNGYSVLLGDTQYDIENEQRYGDMISGREADGLITLLPRIPRIHSSGRLPVVNACEIVENSGLTTVSVDNFAATRDAVTYIVALGHRDIAFIGGPPDNPVSIARKRGFAASMAAAGLQIDARLCTDGGFSLESGGRAADLILSHKQKVTAIICASDELAIGAMRSIRMHGLKIPADISVVGFDDISFARYTDPPMTTVAQPRDDLGREAMLMLLQILGDPKTPVRHAVLPTQLIVRGSTGRPPE